MTHIAIVNPRIGMPAAVTRAKPPTLHSQNQLAVAAIQKIMSSKPAMIQLAPAIYKAHHPSPRPRRPRREHLPERKNRSNQRALLRLIFKISNKNPKSAMQLTIPQHRSLRPLSTALPSVDLYSDSLWLL